MKKIGKTLNRDGEWVQGYECEICKGRTVFPDDEHDCKGWNDAVGESKENGKG